MTSRETMLQVEPLTQSQVDVGNGILTDLGNQNSALNQLLADDDYEGALLRIYSETSQMNHPTVRLAISKDLLLTNSQNTFTSCRVMMKMKMPCVTS